MANNKPALVQLEPHAAVNIVISQTAPVAGVMRSLPSLIVPPGASVLVMGALGSTTNGAAIFVATSQGALQSGNGATAVPPSYFAKDGLPMAVSNLNQIWWRAVNPGDSITVLITGPAVG